MSDHFPAASVTAATTGHHHNINIFVLHQAGTVLASQTHVPDLCAEAIVLDCMRATQNPQRSSLLQVHQGAGPQEGVQGLGGGAGAGHIRQLARCIATWQANAAQDMTGKAVAVWLPISAFAMLGFEHCIGELSLQDQLMGLAGNRHGKGQTCNEIVADCVLVACARAG